MQELIELPIETSEGAFVASYSKRGLCKLTFPVKKVSRKWSSLTEVPRTVQEWHAKVCDALEAALHGKPNRKMPPLDLSAGTEFQQLVWNALIKVPSGETTSYTELARLIGKPRAARAVGGACGANPVPVLVPCHRVLAAGKRLGGFSGGIEWKRRLLSTEAQATPLPMRVSPQ